MTILGMEGCLMPNFVEIAQNMITFMEQRTDKQIQLYILTITVPMLNSFSSEWIRRA